MSSRDVVVTVLLASLAACASDAATSAAITPEETAITGDYSLVLVGGNPPPVETAGGYTGQSAPFGQCDLVIESGALSLTADLGYRLTRSNHYRCPAGDGKFVNTSPSFVVTGQGQWSYTAGALALSQVTNTDFTINAAKVTQAGQISIDLSLVGCAPNPGFSCVGIPDIVFRFGK